MVIPISTDQWHSFAMCVCVNDANRCSLDARVITATIFHAMLVGVVICHPQAERQSKLCLRFTAQGNACLRVTYLRTSFHTVTVYCSVMLVASRVQHGIVFTALAFVRASAHATLTMPKTNIMHFNQCQFKLVLLVQNTKSTNHYLSSCELPINVPQQHFASVRCALVS